ncbi:MAG: DUF2249 domain-containing protein [Nocardiopsaceae bacterium]|nr:DUF2249 domain-containing protein [Nocardiopsaceae bacterium]
MTDHTALTTTAASPSDSRQQATITAIRSHHAQLGRTLADHTLTIQDAIDRLSVPAERRARLVDFCSTEVLPHAAAEEETLYSTAAELPELRLLVRAMREEHTVLRDLVGRLEAAQTQGEIAGTAAALNALFQTHLAKENDLLLPALAEAGVDLDSLLTGMHDILGSTESGAGAAPGSEDAGCCGHGCTCGGHDADAGGGADTAELVDSELDVRTLAPAQRHQQIFAAFEALAAHMAFVLVNDHDPKPLYYQFAAEYPGEFTWDYIESGPQVWRVQIGRP